MAVDLKPNQTKPNERKKKNHSKKIKIREGKKFGQMKEHNHQGLFCNIEILTSFSKKIRIISRIYNRRPPKKMFRKRKEKKLDATGCNDGRRMDHSPAMSELS
jgi:hypothetical protein